MTRLLNELPSTVCGPPSCCQACCVTRAAIPYGSALQDGEIMCLAHRYQLTYDVQFHPTLSKKPDTAYALLRLPETSEGENDQPRLRTDFSPPQERLGNGLVDEIGTNDVHRSTWCAGQSGMLRSQAANARAQRPHRTALLHMCELARRHSWAAA